MGYQGWEEVAFETVTGIPTTDSDSALLLKQEAKNLSRIFPFWVNQKMFMAVVRVAVFTAGLCCKYKAEFKGGVDL